MAKPVAKAERPEKGSRQIKLRHRLVTPVPQFSLLLSDNKVLHFVPFLFTPSLYHRSERWLADRLGLDHFLDYRWDVGSPVPLSLHGIRKRAGPDASPPSGI